MAPIDARTTTNESNRPLHVLAISEHYFPRVGGTVNYLHETLCALSRQNVNAELWVPGPAPVDWRKDGLPPPYKVVWIDAGYPPQGEPDRKTRYNFCSTVNEMAQERAVSPDPPDLLHVVFGLFVMETLNTKSLRQNGLHSIATVHNVPPHECRVVTPEASFTARLKEEARLAAVKLKNRARIKAHPYDAIVVPSEQVRELLSPVLPKQAIDVIGHGPTASLINLMSPPVSRRPKPGEPVRLLTAGGYAPHKRQHLIPQIAERLRSAGLNFEWDVVGPSSRIAGYFEGVANAVETAQLSDKLRIRSAASSEDLAELYDKAHIYIQPSIEEGFCITALDAAAAGLPVIASPAGALAQITKASGGLLVESDPAPLSKAIMEFVQGFQWGNAGALSKEVRIQFSWDAAATQLRACYDQLVKDPKRAHV